VIPANPAASRNKLAAFFIITTTFLFFGFLSREEDRKRHRGSGSDRANGKRKLLLEGYSQAAQG
jgi:hypothetical protein